MYTNAVCKQYYHMMYSYQVLFKWFKFPLKKKNKTIQSSVADIVVVLYLTNAMF